MTNPTDTPSIKSRLSKEEMSHAFRAVLRQKDLINEQDTSVLFYDLSFLTNRITDLQNRFPSSTLHTIAVKANPLTKILYHLKTLNTGLEVASLPELFLAEKTGFPPGRIVFDSPCKTKKEIEYALKAGIYFNADSFQELERIDEILKRIKSESIVGLRINPQVGSGAIKSTSVADSISKFGIPVNGNQERIKDCYHKYEWLKGIHVHIGSQGCPVQLIIEGIRKVVDLANLVNDSSKQMSGKSRIEFFDIGGGLPVSYHSDRKPFTMEEYQVLLAENFKEFFDGSFKLITEFGRYIYSNSGWAASRVEYVKEESSCNMVMTHVGADLLLRKCYNPDDWHHEITVVDKNGNLKLGTNHKKYMIAGPLCFAGDIIAGDLELPEVGEGDFLLIHDVGAYTLSMWSRYNSRQMPKVIGYQDANSGFGILKERETKENLFDFWS